MKTGEKIKLLRLERGWSLQALASKMDYTSRSSISKIESGVNEIPQSKLKQFADVFGVSPASLLDDEPFKFVNKENIFTRIQDQFGKNALNILLDFDSMNENGKRQAAAIVSCLSQVPKFKRKKETSFRSIPVYSDPAAAGSPIYAESEFEYMDVDIDILPDKAEFGVRISGDSMQPTIKDNSIVWVQKATSVNDGEIGIFMLDGGNAVCKRAKLNNSGKLYALISDNPVYKPIKGAVLNGVRIVGKVLL